MDEPAARSAAEGAKAAAGVPADYRFESAQRRFIELAEGSAGAPSRVRDCLAWVVRYSGEMGGWRDLAIEDATGKVVRVQRSK
ncbi:MAG TPA: hypothetical protein VFC90_09845 [Planctomycetota bacterium]|nr:hypothetical protein [Planctomycetota bacterium]